MLNSPSTVAFFVLFVLAVLMAPPTAHARGEGGGFKIQLSLAPSLTSTATGDFDTTKDPAANGLGVDARTSLGFSFGGFFVGGSFNYLTGSVKADVAGGGSIELGSGRMEVGPTLGYMAGGFHILGSYMLLATKTATTVVKSAAGTTVANDETTAKGGSGFQVNLGYSFMLGSSISLGPSLVYHRYSYSKETFKDAVTPTNDYTDTDYNATKELSSALTPMVTLTFHL